MSFDVNLEPPRHTRLSVFFRLLLALPLLLVEYVVEIVALLLFVITWPYAIVMGRLPDAMHNFQVGYVRFSANVDAYTWLVTSGWPRITLKPYAANNVEIRIPQRSFGRLSALFRPILAIPAWAVASILNAGMLPFLVLMWVCAWATRRTPSTFHQAAATVIRFSRKFAAYFLLTTSEWPFHNFWRGVSWVSEPVEEGRGQQETLRRLAGLTATKTWDVTTAARVCVSLALVVGIAIEYARIHSHSNLNNASYLQSLRHATHHTPPLWSVNLHVVSVSMERAIGS